MNPLLKIPDCEVGTRVPEKVRLLPFIIGKTVIPAWNY